MMDIRKGYWLGKKRSPETVEKIRQANLGKHRSPATEFKPGQVSHNKGTGMTPEQKKEARKETMRRYNNKPERVEFMRLYSEQYRHSGKKGEVDKRYYYSPKGMATAKMSSHARRARELALPGKFDPSYWIWLCQHLDYRCQMCGHQFPPERLTLDHIVPLARGGGNDWANVQPLCKSCNSSKRDELLVDLMSNAMHSAQRIWREGLHA